MDTNRAVIAYSSLSSIICKYDVITMINTRIDISQLDLNYINLLSTYQYRRGPRTSESHSIPSPTYMNFDE